MNFLLDWFTFLWNGIRQFVFNKPIKFLFESAELLPLEMENGEGKVKNTIYTDEQQKRTIKCRTKEGKYFEVPWCLLMQSKLFSDMWTNLGQETKMMNPSSKQRINTGNEEHKNNEENSNLEPFIFQLPTISEKCFCRIVDWMRHRHGKPEFELKFGKETRQQIWFKPDEWERNFGFGDGVINMDLEEFYLAANYLDLHSLFHYCVQEFAIAIIQAKKLEEIREILCLVDDLTPEEKAAIFLEFDIPISKEKKPNYCEREKETKNDGKIRNPLPPELVHPIFAKLSLSDQRWLLTLNHDAYKYLADRVRKKWPKWMDKLKVFIIEENPNLFFGHTHVYIPQLEAGLPPVQWTASHFLANRPLQTEMLLTQTFVDQKFDSMEAEPIDGLISDFGKERVIRNRLKSAILQAIKHMDALFGAEREFQRKLEVISKRYEQITSMDSYKRGVLHLMEERRQILEELEANGMQELKKKLAESENWISEYWVQHL